MLLDRIYVLILLLSVSVLVLLTRIFVGVLMLLCTILMVERIPRVPFDNWFNNLMVWIHINV